MNTTIVAIIRHVLTGAGVLLAERGVASSEELQAVVGALITIGSFCWMLFSKSREKKKAAEATTPTS